MSSTLPVVCRPLSCGHALSLGERVALNRAHARGLVFREIRPKEAFTLVDSTGRFFRASLIALDPEGGEAQVYEAMDGSPESPGRITLLCAVLARQRMLGVIQKATELGVVRVVPVISERSVQAEGLAHEKAHAWPAQALRASRQCRRASVPEVRAAVPLSEALVDESFASARLRFYLDVEGDRGELTGARELESVTDIAFVVGPEGGFSDQERQLLAAQGARRLRLGGRVLRAETAALVGTALLQHRYGDL